MMWKGFPADFQQSWIAAMNVILGGFFVCLTTKLAHEAEKDKKTSHRKKHIHNKVGIISKDYVKEIFDRTL